MAKTRQPSTAPNKSAGSGLDAEQVQEWLFQQYERVDSELEELDPEADGFRYKIAMKAREGLHAGLCACKLIG